MSSPHQSVPPAKSSHTAPAGSDTGGGSAATVIRIPRLAFLGVFILFMCVFFMFVGWPIGLWWLLLIPVAVIVWILRTQTTVSEAGLDLRTVFKSRHLDWSQLKGVRIPKRGYVRADLIDGTEVKLPAVSYDRVRDLAVASQGRIPNPYAVPPAEAGSTSADAGSTRTDPSSTSADAGSSGETGSTSADAGAVSADTVAASDDATAAAVETDGGADTSDSGKDADKRESDARKNGAE
ncbi:PH (Pleckstrin Homology) domain-containing protein [Nocardia tenerifensis]|uniref:PH (Pleckstrin Homology) domain-containing protein n=1 Tax=Nocardia tenerifensis TaxID=228006 RepID=A0A318K1P7_9NOCA|nr:PH domain-containing protein [Nocardia tenerifensis]PXX64188.1 PH (Pleckstrin Homology) domain-containing protein [Nocardia tenerifensis]